VPTAAELKTRLHQQYLGDPPESWRVRLHRALSWLARAEQETDDLDARFVFQWIALNAAYARELGREEGERMRFQHFVDELVALDAQGSLHDALFRQFTGPIRVLIENRHVFEPFWTALRTHDSSGQWEVSFAGARRLATAAILDRDTRTVLSIVFDRLYVLRNQIVHGGATWNSRVNREQLRDAVAILGALLPALLDIMIAHPQHDLGGVLYPVVSGAVA